MGGSIAMIDLDAKMSAGFAMNKMSAEILMDTRKTRLMNALAAAYDAL